MQRFDLYAYKVGGTRGLEVGETKQYKELQSQDKSLI